MVTQDEARKLIDEAVTRIGNAKAAMGEARSAIREVGLDALGLKAGDVILCDGRRWSVTGASIYESPLYCTVSVVPAARMILSTGKVGQRTLSEYAAARLGWTKE